jgi:site-specific recombinase XerD
LFATWHTIACLFSSVNTYFSQPQSCDFVREQHNILSITALEATMSQLAEAIETYIYVITGLSEHTQISYRDKLKVFEQFCSERNIDLADITPKVFRHFIQHISERVNPQTKEKIRGHTITSYGRVVKVFLRWVSGYEEFAGCIKTGIIHALAVPKLDQKTKTTLTAEEIGRLYAACKREGTHEFSVRATAIFSVLLDTGLRASELCVR